MSAAMQSYTATLLIYLGVNAIACWGLNLQFGVGGVMNFAFILYQAMGAYITAVLTLPAASSASAETYVFGGALLGRRHARGRQLELLATAHALLDEPMAGVNPTLRLTIEDHLRRLRDGGLTMLMVEHELGSVDRVCDSVIVMAQGKLLATGTMAELRGNEEVVSAYLAG